MSDIDPTARECRHESWELTYKFAGTMREQVFQFIWDRGFRGATNEEIADSLKLRINSAVPRTNELFKLGLVKAIGKRQATSGNYATVWVAASKFARSISPPREEQGSLFPPVQQHERDDRW